MLSIAAAGLFAVQGDDRGFYLTRGEAFYVQVSLSGEIQKIFFNKILIPFKLFLVKVETAPLAVRFGNSLCSYINTYVLI